MLGPYLNRVIRGIFCALILSAQPSFAQITQPTDISDLVFWVDANDVNANGVQPANGSTINRWNDKSGFGHDLLTTVAPVTFQATGFDGVNPGIRLPSGSDMDGPNLFPTDLFNQQTIFIVMSNETYTNNFAVNLNGHQRSGPDPDGRFSFHAPWTDGVIYFDAGPCCTITRVSAPLPYPITDTIVLSGINDEPGGSQRLRIDANLVASDNDGHNAHVLHGMHIGSTEGSNLFDGWFAEIVIYKRALEKQEIDDVECYLMLKWKAASAHESCFPVVSATKSVEVWDPDASNLYVLPGNEVVYTITATHVSGPPVDADTMFMVDAIPTELIFYNGDFDGAGPLTDPVKFTDNGSGINFNYASHIAYSDQAAKPVTFPDCAYSPAAGYDPNITYLCFQPSGAFGTVSGPTSFGLSFRARIK